MLYNIGSAYISAPQARFFLTNIDYYLITIGGGGLAFDYYLITLGLSGHDYVFKLGS